MSKREVAVLQRQLLTLIESLAAVQVQNRLMACTDRDIGLSLLGVDEHAVDRVLHHVSPKKAERIRDEIRMDRSRHVESRYVAMAVRTVIASLQSERAVAGSRSYLRPRRRRRPQ